VEDFLKGLFLFAQFDAYELARIAELIEIRHFEAGEEVVRQDEPVGSIYLIREGSVRVAVDRPDGAGRDVVAMLRVGDTFGELSLLDQEPPAASVVTQEPSVLYVLDDAELTQLMIQNLGLANKILWSLSRTLARRLRETDHSLSLARQAAARGQVQADSRSIPPPPQRRG
jgi:CRP/FNR family transcriptional regulator/CRP/FNR family cyclic AMP-dependent transcriptional regulator